MYLNINEAMVRTHNVIKSPFSNIKAIMMFPLVLWGPSITTKNSLYVGIIFEKKI